MYVVVEHQIKNPEVAFVRGERLIKAQGAPPATRVLQFYPSRDRSSVVCLWDAPSVETVQEYVDAALGDSSQNTCWEVETDHAFARQAPRIADSPALNA